MVDVRLNGLLAYLDRLVALKEADYYCGKEIDECIEAIRKEVGLSDGE